MINAITSSVITLVVLRILENDVATVPKPQKDERRAVTDFTLRTRAVHQWPTRTCVGRES